MSTKPKKAGARAKHDHRQSLWLIAGGAIVWCYRCGAWRLNLLSNNTKNGWHRPTGLDGKNPAMKEPPTAGSAEG